MTIETTDFLVIGGGIIGVNLAIHIKHQYPASKVLLIEKETNCGQHASGRNSGILHAGFYYTANSLKAKFTKDGNKQLTDYCKEKGLLINNSGKLVVAQNENELVSLKELKKRGDINKIELHEITEKEAQEIEPRVKTFQKALFSPTTSSVDPKEVLASLIKDAVALGVTIQTGTAFEKREKDYIITSSGKISTGFIINAAGLYADKIARAFGFSKQYKIIPFKGLYLISKELPGAIRTNIYPVPNLNNPFLGVHFTITSHGKIKIGPTAIPAFWREHYQGFENFNFNEFAEILGQEVKLFLRNDFGFRSLAMEELVKYYKPTMVKFASNLAKGVKKENYSKRGAAGIRAQLFNIESNQLEMDFRYEGDKRSFHILNAVSPAFTCSMSFTKHITAEISKILSN
jgi:(S)-2-hydroxyglutarate dehydrogenase